MKMTVASLLTLLLATSAAADRRAGDLPDRERVAADCSDYTLAVANSGPACPNAPAQVFATVSHPSSFYWESPPPFGYPILVEQNPVVGIHGPWTVFVRRTADGCEKTATTFVETKDPTEPVLEASDERFCGPGTFTVTMASDPAQYGSREWVVQRGTILSGQGTTQVQVATDVEDDPDAGVIVSLRTTDLATGCPTGGSVSVTTRPIVTADITTVSSACGGQVHQAETNAVESSSHGYNPSYQWSITNGTFVSAPTGFRFVSYTPSGTGDVTLTVVSTRYAGCCEVDCSATDTVTIDVSGASAHVEGDLFACAGESVTIPIALTGTAPFTVQWSDGFVQEVPTASGSRTVTAGAAKTYSIATVTSGSCTSPGTGSVLVAATEGPQFAVQPKSGSVRYGQRATLTVQTSGEGVTYSWYRGVRGDRSNLLAGGPSPQFITPPLTSTTQFWVEAQNDCGAAQSQTATVAVALGRRRAVRH